MPNVQTPDGKVHAFPEGTPPEAIQRALGNYMMNRPGPPMLQRAHPEMGIGPNTEENPGRGWRDQARAERFPGVPVPGLGTMNLPAIGATVGSVGGPPGAALGGGLGELGQQLGETLTGEPDLSSMPLSERASRIGTAGATAYGSAKVLPVLGRMVGATARAVPRVARAAWAGAEAGTPEWLRGPVRRGLTAAGKAWRGSGPEDEIAEGLTKRYGPGDWSRISKMGSSAEALPPRSSAPVATPAASRPPTPYEPQADVLAARARLTPPPPPAPPELPPTARPTGTGLPREMPPIPESIRPSTESGTIQGEVPPQGPPSPTPSSASFQPGQAVPTVSPRKAAYLQAQGIEPEAIENFHQPPQMPKGPGGGTPTASSPSATSPPQAPTEMPLGPDVQSADLGGFRIEHSPKTGTFGIHGPAGEKVGGRILGDRIEMTSIGKGSSPNSQTAVDTLRRFARAQGKPVYFTSTNLSTSGGAFRERMMTRGDLIETPQGLLLKGTEPSQ